MKVVCEGCQAKYKIPDERVAGRKLKIRCRKCSHAIIIRGDLLTEEAPPAEPHGPRATEWHISFDGDSHGPFASEELAEMLVGGQVSWDTYVWREGYPDWLLARDSETLVRIVDPEAAALTRAPEDEGPTNHVYQGEAHADPFAAAAPGSFGGVSPAEAFATGAPAGGGHGYALTGERNEDSVLFSLGNLQQASAQPAPAAQARQGYADADGSGLIDIRALASLASASHAQAEVGAAEAAPLFEGNGHAAAAGGNGSLHSAERYPELVSQTGAFATLDSLSPIDHPPQRQSNALPIAIVAGSAMIAVAGFAAAVIIYRPQAPAPGEPAAAAAVGEAAEPEVTAEPELAQEPEVAEAPVEEAEAESGSAVAEASAADQNSPGVAAVKTAAQSSTKPSAPSAIHKSTDKAERKPRRAGKTVSAKAAAKSPMKDKEKVTKDHKSGDKGDDSSFDDLLLGKSEPKETPKPAAAIDDVGASETQKSKKAPAEDRSIDDLLDTAVSDGKPAEKLPESPSRGQVLKAMRSVEAQVRACGGDEALTGTAKVAVTVTGSTGRISSVRVTGIQGAIGSCIARAVRKASFSRFSKADFKFEYPYRFR